LWLPATSDERYGFERDVASYIVDVFYAITFYMKEPLRTDEFRARGRGTALLFVIQLSILPQTSQYLDFQILSAQCNIQLDVELGNILCFVIQYFMSQSKLFSTMNNHLPQSTCLDLKVGDIIARDEVN
jgi:hypothetical protein